MHAHRSVGVGWTLPHITSLLPSEAVLVSMGDMYALNGDNGDMQCQAGSANVGHLAHTVAGPQLAYTVAG